MNKAFYTLAVALSVLGLSATAADLPGAKDHPLINRYQGSELVAQESIPFEANQIPANYADFDGWKTGNKQQTVEGSRTRLVYLSPKGRGAYEVQKNYEAALQQAGATKLLACSGQDTCKGAANNIRDSYVDWVLKLDPKKQNSSAFGALNYLRDKVGHALYKITRAGDIYYVTVITSQDDGGTSTDDVKERAATVIEIIQAKAMETGKVSVASADAMKKGLEAEGKMAVYGIFFDTGKADVKAESKAQLTEMAKLLNANKALKVFIVGHTDNQGTIDGNVALSQNRAAAILATLVKDYKVSASQLNARGVASFAPVAANTSEAGRAKNRRVELVVQ